MQNAAKLIYFSVALALLTSVANANPYSDDVVSQLNKQGFKGIKVQSTWLGRLSIDATRMDGDREIVLNPRTGEILRDQWTPSAPGIATKPVLDSVGQSETDGTNPSESGQGSGEHTSSSSGASGGSDSGSSSSGGSGHDDHSDGGERGDSGGGEKGDN